MTRSIRIAGALRSDRQITAPVHVQRLGLSMFLVRCGETRLLTDPWLVHNPTMVPDLPESGLLEGLAGLLVSHGHFDHSAGLQVALDASPGAKIVAPYELAQSMRARGLPNTQAANLGGTVSCGGAKVTLVPASHSSTYGPDRQYAGAAAGMIITFDEGLRIYYAGDTGLTAEMTIIRDYWQPDLVIIPVGGWLTMDPAQAAYATSELLQATHVIPCHYFPRIADAPDPEGLERMLEGLPGLETMVDRGIEFARLIATQKAQIGVTVLDIGDEAAFEIGPQG